MAMSNIEKARPISLNDLEKLKSEIEADIKALVLNIPSGAIMWFNLTSAPAGWVVCDGKNGTPNLIGKYPLGAVSSIGTAVSAGLPNITGSAQIWAPSNQTSGAFKISNLSGGYGGENKGGLYSAKFDLTASDSNDIYGKSNTVTPPSVKLLPCMKL